MSDAIVKVSQLVKTFVDGENEVQVLNGVDLTVAPGECVAIVGASGSGKSTLLHLMGGLDSPTSGEVIIHGDNIHQLSEKKRAKLRNRHLGFIYQFHHLLREFTALENVMVPLLIGHCSVKEAQKLSQVMLESVGLGHRLTHKVGEMSGGERQRCAIARALVHQPACIFADEPTGNLDSETAQQVLDVMLAQQKTHQASFVIVTHDTAIAQRADRVLSMNKGLLSHSS